MSSKEPSPKSVILTGLAEIEGRWEGRAGRATLCWKGRGKGGTKLGDENDGVEDCDENGGRPDGKRKGFESIPIPSTDFVTTTTSLLPTPAILRRLGGVADLSLN